MLKLKPPVLRSRRIFKLWWQSYQSEPSALLLQTAFWKLRLCMVCCECTGPAERDPSLLMLYMHLDDFVLHSLCQECHAEQSEGLMHSVKVLVHQCTSCWKHLEGLCMLGPTVMSCSHPYLQDRGEAKGHLWDQGRQGRRRKWTA